MPRTGAIEWLLEEDEPSIRYRTLTEILGRKGSEPQVRRARHLILEKGWGAKILSERVPGVGWGDGPTQYRPKYTSTHWRMLVLSELGLTRDDPGIRELCEFWMGGFAANNGGLGANSGGTPHYCVGANMARAAIRFGYGDDPRVRRTMEWLAEIADPKGGWSCFGSGRNLDSWEALSAFAVYPRRKWTPDMQAAVEKGAEFFLQRELHVQGSNYPPWYRFHYPIHYYYDVLVGLDFLTTLGYGGDPRLGFALDLLRRKQRRDGRWNLDAIHPDVEGGMAKWYSKHPKDRPTPWGIETPGKPSKMVTFAALKVLSRLEAPARKGPKRS
jgi:hypothetical protein